METASPETLQEINEQPLKFWKKHTDMQSDFFVLSKAVAPILTISTSNAMAERIFSKLKLWVGERRSRMTKARVNEVVTLSSRWLKTRCSILGVLSELNLLNFKLYINLLKIFLIASKSGRFSVVNLTFWKVFNNQACLFGSFWIRFFFQCWRVKIVLIRMSTQRELILSVQNWQFQKTQFSLVRISHFFQFQKKLNFMRNFTLFFNFKKNSI